MAYNLTIDSTDDPIQDVQDEARDLESYEIGDKLQQEQEQLLAGKYRDAEELEQAYIELQRKLGSKSTDDDSNEELQQDTEEAQDDEDEIDYSFLDRLASEAESGQFAPETLQALEQMSAADIADMFLAYREQQPEQQESYEMTSEDINEMKQVAGGEQQYNQMVAWAAQNLSPEEIQVFDSVVDKGDPQAIYFAIQALNYRYQDAVGTDGRLLTGMPAQTQDVFRSQAEVVRAMSDPRYESDPAYRQDIFDKLDRSNIQF